MRKVRYRNKGKDATEHMITKEQIDWNRWLLQNPGFVLAGRDNEDVETDDDDVDTDDDDDDSDDDDSDDDDEDDAATHKARANRLQRKLDRQQAQIDLLTEKLAEKDGAAGDKPKEGETPDGFVAQSDYDDLTDIIRTDFVEHAISGFKDKEGNPKWDWEDTSAVYKFLDVDDLEFDIESKTIDGLEDQLKAIAARYPFLLKGNGKNGGTRNGKTGTKPGKSGTREEQKNQTRDQLLTDFPALAN